MTVEFTTLLVDFAKAGRIGPLYVGMGRSELSGALRQLGLPAALETPDSEFSDRHESLEIAMVGGQLVLLGLDHDGDLEFVLPSGLGKGGSQEPSRLSKAETVILLDQAACPWAEDAALTFAGQQSAIRTAAGVSLVFTRPSEFDLELPGDDELLASAYLSLKAQ